VDDVAVVVEAELADVDNVIVVVVDIEHVAEDDVVIEVELVDLDNVVVLVEVAGLFG
jgi:hypothetical protein